MRECERGKLCDDRTRKRKRERETERNCKRIDANKKGEIHYD